ncbi:BNR-4 repeat-containing protein [Microbulbifer elongatus]|uniref:BNR-4 repeat-containing protein n=1 Tax=Microbulbifer elongatus TaxID=86173 RepID=A0ABT1P277_9GAMM|nr:BNR-4 repeat-containing protein [Microbulbifer elongatus]MCQ3830196.1 BNR-4 repeat-containing protein [Microbulbifer elongatus]
MKKWIAGLALASAYASAQVAVEPVPVTVDSSNQAGWWKPIAISGGEIYFAANTPGSSSSKHQGAVAVRRATGAWETGALKQADGTIWEHGDDLGHDQPTIAVDGDGFIHIFTDLHNNGWNYFRSSTAGNIDDIRRRTDIVPGSASLTYPVAATAPNGDVYVAVRNRAGGQGGKGELVRWDNSANLWIHEATFAFNPNDMVYPDDIKVDANGTVHIIFQWAAGATNPMRHYGSYLTYSPASGQFTTADGQVVTTPVSLSTPGLFYQALEEGEEFVKQSGSTSSQGKGIQSAKLALDGQNRPSVTYRYRTSGSAGARDYNVYRIRWDGIAWVDKTLLFDTDDTIAALGHTHDGTVARSYFVTDNKELMVAEKRDGSWSSYILDNTRSIERIAVQRAGNIDHIYATSPTGINSNSGSLYAFEVGTHLTSVPEQTCLSGTLSGSQPGTYHLTNQQYGQQLTGGSSDDLASVGNDTGSSTHWILQDGDSDGEFGLISDANGVRLTANGSGALISVTQQSFSNANMRWKLIDSNNDGGYAVINVDQAPEHLQAQAAGGQVQLGANSPTPAGIWHLCKTQ